MKEKLIETQTGKKFLYPPEPTRLKLDGKTIENCEDLDEFCDEILNELEKGVQLVVLDTRGDSDMWKAKRAQIDGERFFKSAEPAGVNIIAMRIMSRNDANTVGVIHVGKIIEEELNEKPILPERLNAIFLHPNAVFVGENVSRHLVRLKNLFFKELNGPRYVGITDMVRRLGDYEFGIYKSFEINPFSSSGVIYNFQKIFPGKTYVKDPFQACSNWNNTQEITNEQYGYVLDSLWASAYVLKAVCKRYEEEGLQLSCMVTVFPRRVFDERVDRVHLNGREPCKRAPAWFLERVWPCVESTGAPGCRVGLGNPQKIRELQQDEFEERFGKVPESMLKVRKRDLDSDISDSEKMDPFVDEEEEEKPKLQKRAKEVAIKLRNSTTEEELTSLFWVGKGDVVDFAVGIMHSLTNQNIVKRVLRHYSSLWPEGRKCRFIEVLWFERYFDTNKSAVGVLTVCKGLHIDAPDPRIFLLFRKRLVGIKDFIAIIRPTALENTVAFLSSYLDSTDEERIIQLESFPMFCRPLLPSYVRKDDEIVHLISTICGVSGLTPPRAYFRKTLHNFVQTIINHGKNCRLSVENAKKQALAFASDDIRDRGDMIVSLGQWPAVGNAVKRESGLWRDVPRFEALDPNLATEPSC